jgi:AraC family transcriptional regulator
LSIELYNEMQSGNSLGPLYADSLANTLVLYLLRRYSNGQTVDKPASSRLTPAQLRLVDEYIYAHLELKISLADLATCLHLSVPHF